MSTKIGYRVFIGIEKYCYDPRKGTSSKVVIDGNVLESVAGERVVGSAIHGDWTIKGYCQTLQEADSLIASMMHLKPPFTGYPCSCIGTGGLHAITGDASRPRSTDRGVTHRPPGWRRKRKAVMNG